MKKIILTISFLLFVVFMFGQKNKTNKKTESDSLLPISEVNFIGKWKIDYIEYDGLKEKKIKQKHPFIWTYEFFRNNSYEEISNTFTIKGKWKVENSNLLFQPNDEKQLAYQGSAPIEKITREKFSWSAKSDSVEMEVFRIFYFIRIE